MIKKNIGVKLYCYPFLFSFTGVHPMMVSNKLHLIRYIYLSKFFKIKYFSSFKSIHFYFYLVDLWTRNSTLTPLH